MSNINVYRPQFSDGEKMIDGPFVVFAETQKIADEIVNRAIEVADDQLRPYFFPYKHTLHSPDVECRQLSTAFLCCIEFPVETKPRKSQMYGITYVPVQGIFAGCRISFSKSYGIPYAYADPSAAHKAVGTFFGDRAKEYRVEIKPLHKCIELCHNVVEFFSGRLGIAHQIGAPPRFYLKDASRARYVSFVSHFVSGLKAATERANAKKDRRYIALHGTGFRFRKRK